MSWFTRFMSPFRQPASLAILFICIFLQSSICPCLRADDLSEMEPKLKAVFLYNFLKLVNWEDDGSGDPFVILVSGDSNVVPHLEEISRMTKVKGRPIRALQMTNIDEDFHCHILFLNQEACSESVEIMNKLWKKGVLIVTDCPDSGHQGGAINFIISNGKLKFEVHMGAMEASGLTASSQLLKLARIYKD